MTMEMETPADMPLTDNDAKGAMKPAATDAVESRQGR
jgi:hypothetical protein